jgi:hypothetical protein
VMPMTPFQQRHRQRAAIPATDAAGVMIAGIHGLMDRALVCLFLGLPGGFGAVARRPLRNGEAAVINRHYAAFFCACRAMRYARSIAHSVSCSRRCSRRQRAQRSLCPLIGAGRVPHLTQVMRTTAPNDSCPLWGATTTASCCLRPLNAQLCCTKPLALLHVFRKLRAVTIRRALAARHPRQRVIVNLEESHR